MAAQILKLLGKDFVLLPKREYDQLRAAVMQKTAQDRGDLAESRRRAKEPSISGKQLRKQLAGS